MRKVLFCFFIIPQLCFSQFEAKQWFFGDQAGMDFSSNAAASFNHYSLYAAFGSTVMSDCQGNVLFYSNGSEVLNSQHQHLQNDSLAGSSFQNCLAVPFPDHIGYYYLFYMAPAIQGMNLFYSIIDMTFPGGRVLNRNTLITSGYCNKLAAVHHENKNDFWLISHSWNSNHFEVFLVDQNGILTSPISSNAGNSISGNPDNMNGSLEFAVSGRKFINVTDDGHIGIYNFNRTNGSISLDDDLTSLNISHPSGASFSPDGKMLYINSKISNNLFQVDMTQLSTASRIGSKVLMDHLVSGSYGEMQVALNGKLYIAVGISNRLAEINYPGERFPLCNYQLYGTFLNGNSCLLGLPNFVQTFFDVPTMLSHKGSCTGKTVELGYYPVPDQNLVVSWNTGSNSSIIQSIQGNKIQILYDQPGQYIAMATIQYECGSDTLIDTIEIYPTPIVDLGPDTSLCPNINYDLQLTGIYDSIQWSDGVTANYHLIMPDNVYTIKVVKDGCTQSDKLKVDVFPIEDLHIFKTGLLCEDLRQFPILSINLTSSIKWNPGLDTVNHIKANEVGWYYATTIDSNGCISGDSIYIMDDCPTVVFAPSAFSPNNDGKNDYFFILSDEVKVGSYAVYNKYGEVLFTSNNLDLKWDGTLNNSNCPEGVYLYYLKYIDQKNILHFKRDWFVLLR